MYTCHIIVLAALSATILGQQVQWNGPFADHVAGQLVGDTPEVAEAKRQHYTAFARVRAALPELPEEQQFPHAPNYVHNPVVVTPPSYVPQHFGNPVIQQENQHTWTQFAEEIPRSEIGEVPEVALARKNHLKAVMEVRAILPQLKSDYTTGSPFVPVHHVPQTTPPYWLNNNNNIFPQDTPEVAAAKLEHARLFAAAAGR